jgi:DNA-binding MarR family transcriptional regulator
MVDGDRNRDETVTVTEVLNYLDVERELGWSTAIGDIARHTLRQLYETLVKQVGDEREAEMLVVRNTGLQPAAYRALPIIERVPYLKKAIDGKIIDAASLTMEDMTILEKLAREAPMAVNQYDLESVTGLPRKTIGTRLKALELQGFVQRPKNTTRKGHAITEAGLSALKPAVP